MLRCILAKIIWLLLHVSEIFPTINNKLLFIPKNGEYYCNLKYIDMYMREHSSPIQVIWGEKKGIHLSYPKKVKRCTFLSLSFWFHLFTAKSVVFNDSIPCYFYKKRDQYYINTWHGGGAYKGVAAVFRDEPDLYKRRRVQWAIKNYDFWVSSCEKFSEAIKQDTDIVQINPEIRFLGFGMPRNDIFFRKDQIQKAKDRVLKRYNILEDYGIVLYAPTFRKDFFYNDLDIVKLKEALQKRLKKPFILLLRSHPHIADDIFEKLENRKGVIDVSKYPDMQELLCAADVLITDYSSSMWDFSFTGKPCFIYANDIVSYKADRDFHTPIEEWPFPVASNNEELQENICNFDEKKYAQDIDLHHRNLGSYEDGHAAERVSNFIIGLCSDKEK